MAALPVNVPASVRVKVSGHRKFAGCMASASVPLKVPASVMVRTPASVSLRATASLPVRASASLPVKESAPPVSEVKKLPGDRELKDFKSGYVFLRYAGPDELKSYDRLDVGLFGRSWIAHVSWSVVFAPGVREDNWKDYLTNPREKFMNTGDLVDVIASGSSNGVIFAIDSEGYRQRAAHGVRTVVPLNELKTDARVQSGGSLLLHIGLVSIWDNGEVVADSEYTFDGQVYWNLFSS